MREKGRKGAIHDAISRQSALSFSRHHSAESITAFCDEMYPQRSKIALSKKAVVVYVFGGLIHRLILEFNDYYVLSPKALHASNFTDLEEKNSKYVATISLFQTISIAFSHLTLQMLSLVLSGSASPPSSKAS